MDLSVLANLQVAKPETSRPSKYNTICKNGGDFIVTKNGAIYFSDEFTKNLTVNADGEMNYLDMIDGRLMKFDGGVKIPFLFVGILPHGAKVPSISGGDGKSTFVKKKLLPLLSELYNINWETTNEVEMKLLPENKVNAYNNIHYIPRINKKGELKYIRREHVDVIPCVPVDALSGVTSEDKNDAIVLEA